MKIWRRSGPADPRRVLEKTVQEHVKEALAVFGWQVWDTSQPFRAAITPGLPDLICLHPRRGVLFVEVKAPRGTLSAAQRAFQAACQSAGVCYLVARSAADLVAQLEEPS